MKPAYLLLPLVLTSAIALADSADSSFMKDAAEGGLSEIELGQMAQEKGTSQGAMMIKDHTAANKKLQALAEKKQVSLPDSPSIAQKASKAKLSLMSGNSFDKSYISGMIEDHKADIKEFTKEATDGQDPAVKAYARATLPTLKKHLQKIEVIGAAAGVSG